MMTMTLARQTHLFVTSASDACDISDPHATKVLSPTSQVISDVVEDAVTALLVEVEQLHVDSGAGKLIMVSARWNVSEMHKVIIATVQRFVYKRNKGRKVVDAHVARVDEENEMGRASLEALHAGQ